MLNMDASDAGKLRGSEKESANQVEDILREIVRSIFWVTLPETNIAPENEWLED